MQDAWDNAVVGSPGTEMISDARPPRREAIPVTQYHIAWKRSSTGLSYTSFRKVKCQSGLGIKNKQPWEGMFSGKQLGHRLPRAIKLRMPFDSVVLL